MVLFYSPDRLHTCDLLASASLMLRLQAWATMHSAISLILLGSFCFGFWFVLYHSEALMGKILAPFLSGLVCYPHWPMKFPLVAVWGKREVSLGMEQIFLSNFLFMRAFWTDYCSMWAEDHLLFSLVSTNFCAWLCL
jgi:hypothetical protein